MFMINGIITTIRIVLLDNTTELFLLSHAFFFTVEPVRKKLFRP